MLKPNEGKAGGGSLQAPSQQSKRTPWLRVHKKLDELRGKAVPPLPPLSNLAFAREVAQLQGDGHDPLLVEALRAVEKEPAEGSGSKAGEAKAGGSTGAKVSSTEAAAVPALALATA